MPANPLLKLNDYGQSVWLDYIHRDMIHNGELERLIRDDGLRGMTSNPKIFDDAIAGSDTYDATIIELVARGAPVEAIYEALAVEDVYQAAKRFRPLYEKSRGAHGYVSLEVNPHIAHDTEATIAEARRLWNALNSPNVHIKVPGTEAGLPAIRRLIADGINVNVTLLFGLDRYRQVVEAYIAGLEDRAEAGHPLEHVHSVASFFLSRIDVLLDPQLEKVTSDQADLARRLKGQIAIASARVSYTIYREAFTDKRFAALKAKGARPQYLLWASTSTKNPDESPVRYVEALIGPDTINTMPRETLDAYREQGQPADRLELESEQALHTLSDLPKVNIDLNQATARLEAEGVEKFIKPFDSLLNSLTRKREKVTSA